MRPKFSGSNGLYKKGSHLGYLGRSTSLIQNLMSSSQALATRKQMMAKHQRLPSGTTTPGMVTGKPARASVSSGAAPGRISTAKRLRHHTPQPAQKPQPASPQPAPRPQTAPARPLKPIRPRKKFEPGAYEDREQQYAAQRELFSKGNSQGRSGMVGGALMLAAVLLIILAR